MTDMDKVVDKVRKLHAHAQSAGQIGNEAEAQAFAAKVQELLIHYKLSMSQIEFEARDKNDPIDQTWVDWQSHGMRNVKTRSAWTERLAAIVTHAYFCQYVVMSGTNCLLIIGREQDRKVAEFMLITIARFLEKISYDEYCRYYYQCQDAGDATRARGFRGAFRIGFIMRLHERFDEELKRVEASVPASSMAIVRLSNALVEVNKWIKNNERFKDTNNVRVRMSDGEGTGEGMRQGRRHANRVNLTPNVLDKTTAPAPAGRLKS